MVARWGGMAGFSVTASSFRWFLGGFRGFLLVEGDFRWFQVVCCFSVLSPGRLKITDTFYTLLCSMSDKKHFLKEIFWIKVTNHKVSRSIAKYLRRGVLAGSVLTGRLIGRLFAFTGRRGEMGQNREISPSDGERRQVCRIVRCKRFRLS